MLAKKVWRRLLETTILCFAAAALVQAGEPWATVQLPPEALQAPVQEQPSVQRGSVLEELWQLAKRGEHWQEWATQRGLLVAGDAVLVEVRFAAAPSGAAEAVLERLGARRHTHNVPTLMEAWVPATALGEVVAVEGVVSVRPARFVRPLDVPRPEAGSVQ